MALCEPPGFSNHRFSVAVNRGLLVCYWLFGSLGVDHIWGYDSCVVKMNASTMCDELLGYIMCSTHQDWASFTY